MKVVCDIDGVLADVRGEYHYLPNWDKYFAHLQENKPINSVIGIIESLMLDGHEVVFVTGRPESTREDTVNWFRKVLTDVLWWGPELIMRQSGDKRHTEELKLEVCKRLKPDLVFEDEPRCVELLSSAGFLVLQVHGFRWSKEDQIPK